MSMDLANRSAAARQKAAVRCAKALRAAAESLADLLSACRSCNDGSGDERRGASDSRNVLRSELNEYANWLDQKYSC